MLSGWCLCVVKGVMVPKQVKKVQLVLYHAASAFKSYIPLSLLQATLASSKGRNNISQKKKILVIPGQHPGQKVADCHIPKLIIKGHSSKCAKQSVKDRINFLQHHCLVKKR